MTVWECSSAFGDKFVETYWYFNISELLTFHDIHKMFICMILLFAQQKLAKREGGTIDRSRDITLLQEFYKQYREKNNVDKLREEEMQLRESGVFSGNLGEYVNFS